LPVAEPSRCRCQGRAASPESNGRLAGRAGRSGVAEYGPAQRAGRRIGFQIPTDEGPEPDRPPLIDASADARRRYDNSAAVADSDRYAVWLRRSEALRARMSPSSGTESLQTDRWRGMDSNFQFRWLGELGSHPAAWLGREIPHDDVPMSRSSSKAVRLSKSQGFRKRAVVACPPRLG
jgi:hypothetical protein